MKLTLYSAFICALTGCGQAFAQTPLDVKTGEWETTTVSQGMSGMPALPPGMMDKMPPEQRAKMEERMKAMSGPRTTVSKRCVTKEDLAKAFQSDKVPAYCKYSLTSSSRSKQEVTVACETEKMKSSGNLVVEAVDTGHIKGDMKMTTSMSGGGAGGAGGPGMNLAFTFDSKWVGPVCAAESKGK